MAKRKPREINKTERAQLLRNEYVHDVSRYTIRFTEEGKMRIWEGVRSGKSCLKVLFEMGIPPIDHVYDIAKRLPHVLKRELAQKGSFARFSGASYVDPAEPKTEKEARLLEELLLKEQELEFLKKITAKANGGK